MNITPALVGSDLTRRLPRRACLWTALWLLAVLAFGLPPARAAVTEMWVQRYKRVTNCDDVAQAVTVDGSGNVVVTGRSYSGMPSPPLLLPYDSDYYTAKYAAANGALLWEQRYSGPAIYSDDSAVAVAADLNGNVVVSGTSFGDYYTVKYAAADGALLWEQRYISGGINGGASVAAMAVDANGNVVVTGFTYNGGGIPEYYTAKYAATDGAILWENRYNGPANGRDYARAVKVDGGGNVIVTGASDNGPSSYRWVPDFYTAKYAAADGAMLWERRYNGPANSEDFASAVAVDGSGNVVVTGTSYNGGNYDYYTAKYAAANGALVWEKRYDGLGLWDEPSAVAVDDRGNAVVTGYSSSDFYTVKYAGSDGALLWEKRFNGPDNSGSSPTSLALGPNGMVAITGYSIPFSSFDKDFATVVYRETLPPVSVGRAATGVRLCLSGSAGHNYQVLRAPVLTGPWSTNATLTAVTNGPLEYLDTNAPSGSAFYRTSTGQ